MQTDVEQMRNPEQDRETTLEKIADIQKFVSALDLIGWDEPPTISSWPSTMI